MPVAAQCDGIGVLLLDGLFQRSRPVPGQPSAWVSSALAHFQKQPARYGAAGVPVRRLWPVLQAWDLAPSELDRTVSEAAAEGSAGIVIAFAPLDQSWKPVAFAGQAQPSPRPARKRN
jgi:hypothetical protein